jgi:signal transduction histidine kinase
LLISIVALYAALALANVAFPYGPYAQVGAIAMPVFALVLLGNRAGRNAIVASIVIIIAAPFVGRAAPGVMYTLGIEPAQMTDPPGLLWFRITVRLACLVGLMVLLESFYRFLSDALAARIAAQRKVERGLQERRHLEREMAAISDEERRHLGQELHDGVCQQLTAALLRCQALQRRLYRGGILSSPDFETLSSLLAETIDDAHNIARGLCPLEPSPDALAPALRVLTKRIQQISGLRCEFLVTGDVRVAAPEAAQHLYRIAQEALSNVARHAHANHVAVELRGTEGELILQVDDDGVGLPAALAVGGMGLRTMSYRAQMLAGELTVAPMPGKGTRVTCRMPRPNGGSSGQDESGEGRWIRAA